jgi:hypothetical protein
LTLKAAPEGSPEAVSVAIASPSGSAAVTVNVIGEFSAPDNVAGAVTTGARSGPRTVISVDAEAHTTLGQASTHAVNVTL